MAKFFTYGWKHKYMLLHPTGEPIGAAYGSQFSRRGICPGDEVYIVSVHRGQVHLLGKMLVRAVVGSANDFRRLVGIEPETAQEYLVAEEATPARLIELPSELVQRLRFQRGKQSVRMTLRDHAHADRQSLRSVRRLGAGSAAALDELLPPLRLYRPSRQVPG